MASGRAGDSHFIPFQRCQIRFWIIVNDRRKYPLEYLQQLKSPIKSACFSLMVFLILKLKHSEAVEGDEENYLLIRINIL